MELFFDVETSGFHKNGIEPDNLSQAWIVQLAFILSDDKKIYHEASVLFQPPDVSSTIHPAAQRTHGISLDQCRDYGIYEDLFFDYFTVVHTQADVLVCHNWNFDKNFVHDMICRCDCRQEAMVFLNRAWVCTMLASTNYCQLPGKYHGKFKWPKLEELHLILFNEDFEGAHDALADVRATRRCYYELVRRGVI